MDYWVFRSEIVSRAGRYTVLGDAENVPAHEAAFIAAEMGSLTANIESHLSGLPPGRVRALVCADVLDTLARIEVDLRQTDGISFVSVGCSDKGHVHDGIRGVLRELARLALAQWPEWSNMEARAQGERVRAVAGDVLPSSPAGVNHAWLQRAAALCERGHEPLPRGFADEVHADGLARALGASDLIVGLFLESGEQSDEHLIAFARIAEWVACHTGARLAALIPFGYRNARGLDSIMHGTITLDMPAVGSGRSGAHGAANVVSPPIVGQPHPASEGEQLLAEALRRDPELGPLFAHNQRVEAGTQDRFLVDVVWLDGKLVVEVDGYRWHTTETNFREDRYRDYRLMTAGYLVLRLPHDLVVDDVELQVDKIRDMVRFIRQRDGL